MGDAGLKWETLSTFGKAMASLAGTIILIGGATVAWNSMSLPVPATQEWVLQFVGEKVQPQLRTVQRQLLEGQLRQIRDSEERAWGEQLALKREVDKASSDNEKRLIETRIKQLDFILSDSERERRRVQQELDKVR